MAPVVRTKAEKRKRQRMRRVRKGLCVDCPQPRVGLSSRCQTCLDRSRDYMRRRQGFTGERLV